MRVAVVVAVVGLASAHADPRPATYERLAFGEYAIDGIDFAPLERPLPITVAVRDGELRLTTTITKLFDARTYDDLHNGLATTIAVQIVVAREGSDDPIASQQFVRTVQYDQWDERFRMRFDEPRPRPSISMKFAAEALKLMTTFDDVPIARVADLPRGENVSVSIVVELNPLSDRARAEVDRWLAIGTAEGGSVFGRLVSRFADPELPAADRVLRVRSAPFRP